MYLLVAVVALSSAAIAIGYRTRPAAMVFLVGFTWIEFIDASTYLNHYWLMTLLGGLMIVAPVDTCLAVQSRSRAVQRGWVWLFRFQIGIVYTFAGLAKLNADWLFHALPLRVWLPVRSDLAIVGPLLEHPSAAYVLSWAGAVFDCTIIGLLCWRRTRPAAWLAVVGFHVATWVLFPIGVFPWLMIGVTTVFFEPGWPTRLVARVSGRMARGPGRSRDGGSSAAWSSRGWATAWVVVMLAIPLRHHLIPGDARWTGEGYRFAWNVLLTEKGADLRFRVVDTTTGVVSTETAADLYTARQWKVMSSEPELIRQAAYAIAARRAAQGQMVAVFADSFVSLNGRPSARLIAPDVDLSREPYRLTGQPWILAAPSTGAPAP
jgi:hypothetical protein